jgi:hypothetical protein
MFTRCFHCCSVLGANEEISIFPVGQRIAFDAAKGRLWVICPTCERWNLSPLEERWEAVETAEALYRGTPTRASTGEIGLARRPSGLDLIRIGTPLGVELAAWRYGRQLLSRFRKAWFQRTVDWVEDEGGVEIAREAMLVGEPVSTALALPVLAARFLRDARLSRRRIRGVTVDGVQLDVRGRHLASARLSKNLEQRWQFEMVHERGVATFRGENILPVLRRVLPYMNSVGASERQLGHAQGRIEHFGTANNLLDFIAARATSARTGFAHPHMYGQRLALEMLVHEDMERRALEGELAMLYHAWEEAEHVAAIADGLLLPGWILERLKRM